MQETTLEETSEGNGTSTYIIDTTETIEVTKLFTNNIEVVNTTTETDETVTEMITILSTENGEGEIMTTEVFDTTTDLLEPTTEVTGTTISSNIINDGLFWICKFIIKRIYL